MLRQRVLSAAVLVPAVIAVVWTGKPWLSLVLGLATTAGVLELYRMSGIVGNKGLVGLGLLWTLLFLAAAYWQRPMSGTLLLISTVVLAFVLVLVGPRRQLFSGHPAWVPIGAIYLGWTLSHYIVLRGLSSGMGWTFLALFAAFATDTGAYFAGRAWGRHLLAPGISPGKTKEGAIAGLISAVLAVIFFDFVFKLPLSLWQAALLGGLVGVFAQLGDLAESKLKRITGVKDSGRLIPGHGGLLDRLDSLVFSGPVVYYVYYVFFGGWH